MVASWPPVNLATIGCGDPNSEGAVQAKRASEPYNGIVVCIDIGSPPRQGHVVHRRQRCARGRQEAGSCAGGRVDLKILDEGQRVAAIDNEAIARASRKL